MRLPPQLANTGGTVEDVHDAALLCKMWQGDGNRAESSLIDACLVHCLFGADLDLTFDVLRLEHRNDKTRFKPESVHAHSHYVRLEDDFF